MEKKSNIFKENELNANSVVKDYLITVADGKQYNVTFYSLDMILAKELKILENNIKTQ
jgi:hypothetical protein